LFWTRNGYHNKEWAVKMRAIGLIPTHTGEPGGKETGQKVTHAIAPGGRFKRACSAFLASGGAVVLYHERQERGSASPQEESRQQDEIHLPRMRPERLGEAGGVAVVRRLPGAVAGRGW
jgi:hypothetical protein